MEKPKRKKKTEAEKELEKKQIEMKARYKEQKKKMKSELLADIVHDKFASQIKKLGSGQVHGFTANLGAYDYRIIAYSKEHNQILVRVMETGWREGWFFYSMDTKKFLKFDKKIHQPEPKTSAIVWQKELNNL